MALIIKNCNRNRLCSDLIRYAKSCTLAFIISLVMYRKVHFKNEGILRLLLPSVYEKLHKAGEICIQKATRHQHHLKDVTNVFLYEVIWEPRGLRLLQQVITISETLKIKIIFNIFDWYVESIIAIPTTWPRSAGTAPKIDTFASWHLVSILYTISVLHQTSLRRNAFWVECEFCVVHEEEKKKEKIALLRNLLCIPRSRVTLRPSS